jgi:hypothetical protein
MPNRQIRLSKELESYTFEEGVDTMGVINKCKEGISGVTFVEVPIPDEMLVELDKIIETRSLLKDRGDTIRKFLLFTLRRVYFSDI